MAARNDGGGGTGSARRQRERRLRAYLRYARMSVAMELAKSRHYSAPSGQRNARAWSPPEPELFDPFEVPGGVRPVLLVQARVERHTRVGYEPAERVAERIVNTAPGVPLPLEGEEQRTLEHVLALVQLVPQEGALQRSVELVVDVPAPLHRELLRRSEQVVDVQDMTEHMEDVPASGAVTFHAPHERIQQRTVDVPLDF